MTGTTTSATTPATADAAATTRRLATGLLAAMALLFVLLVRFAPPGGAWGFARAFAEAGMVGGLADWFAVTALFRDPFRLSRIRPGWVTWHTAIIPRNKDKIGEKLADFLRTKFLRTREIARAMRRLDVARAAGRWLEDPSGRTAGRLRDGAARLFADLLESLDQERLGGMVRAGLAQRLRELDLAPLLGNALAAAIAENRHLPLLDGIVRWAARVLSANEHLVREMVRARAGSILRWTGLDETLANKIVDGLEKMLAEMADDPDHPLRAKAEEGLARLAEELRHSPAMRARVQALKSELIDNPALGDWWQGVWETMRAGLLRIARHPETATAGRFGDALRQLGATLRADATLAATINRFARRTIVGIAVGYGGEIVRLVSDTVHGWDSRTVTGELEQAVGGDLQYIRINGTLVGGLVGLGLHVVDLVV